MDLREEAMELRRKTHQIIKTDLAAPMETAMIWRSSIRPASRRPASRSRRMKTCPLT